MQSLIEQPNESASIHIPSHHHCFACGSINAIGLHLEYQRRDEQSVYCETEIPDAFSGYPGYVHGGIITTMLDEAMGRAARAQEVPVMTAHLDLEYLRPVPTNKPLRIEGRLLRFERRKYWTEGQIVNSQGSVLAKCNGLFIQVTNIQE
jgi:uncharacterized protein (TIGR00369 family)